MYVIKVAKVANLCYKRHTETVFLSEDALLKSESASLISQQLESKLETVPIFNVICFHEIFRQDLFCLCYKVEESQHAIFREINLTQPLFHSLKS